MNEKKLDSYLTHLKTPSLAGEDHKARLRADIVRALREEERTPPGRRRSVRPVLALSAAAAVILVTAAAILLSGGPQTGLRYRLAVDAGNVFLQPDDPAGSRRRVEAPTAVGGSTLISSEAGARFRLELPGGGLFACAGETALRPAALATDGGGFDASIELDRGSVDCAVKLPSPDSRFAVVTPDAVIRVTGTRFTVAVSVERDTILSMAEGTTLVELRLVERLKEQAASRPDLARRIEALAGVGTSVAAGNVLRLRHAEVLELSRQFEALFTASGPEAQRGIPACNDLYRRLMRPEAIDAADPGQASVSPSPPPADGSGRESSAWRPYAENDFSAVITSRNFNTFVRYSAGSGFDLEDGRCVFSGGSAGARGLIFATRPDSAPGRWRITLDTVRLSGGALLAAGAWLDEGRHVFAQANASSLSLRDASGRVLNSAALPPVDWSRAMIEIVVDGRRIVARLVERDTGRVLAEVTGPHRLGAPGEAFIMAGGKGSAVFDNVRIFTGR